MDDWIRQLEQLTLRFIERLDQATHEEVEKFIQEREQIIGQLQTSGISQEDSLKYRERVQMLLSYDPKILAKMNTLMQEASTGINKIRQSRKQNALYQATYTPDSIYFDKKK